MGRKRLQIAAPNKSTMITDKEISPIVTGDYWANRWA